MNTQSYIYQAAGTWVQSILADYFLLMETGAPVTVSFFRNGRQVYQAKNVEAGLCIQREAGNEFDRIEIESYGSQAIKIATSTGGSGSYNRTAGRVDAKLISAQNVLNVSPVTIPANGAETLLLAANPARARAVFFNSSVPAKDIWIGSSGLNLVNACVKVAAGDTWIEEVAAGAAWVAIAASDANVATVKIQETTY